MEEKAVAKLEDLQTSELPLATIGTQAPLVIDLPDGQKLVIGNLDPGMVIEVATWRGTGRPDSRTNRLMLGVSAPEEETPAHDQGNAKKSFRDRDSKPQLRPVISEEEAGALKSENSMSYTVSTSNTVDEEIKRSSALKKRITLKALIKVGAITLAIVLLFAGLVGPGKFRMAHPQSGAASSLGSAVNSLIIFRQDSSAKVGEAVIVDISDSKASPVLAVVSAISGDNYLLATNTEQIQTTREKIHGKVQFVIPYLGFFATLINK